MNEQAQAVEVHLVAFGKGERFANKAPHALPQSIVPSLHMVGLAAVFANGFMLLVGQHFLIRFPKVTVECGWTITQGNRLPQQAAGLLATVANHEGHDLTGAAA